MAILLTLNKADRAGPQPNNSILKCIRSSGGKRMCCLIRTDSTWKGLASLHLQINAKHPQCYSAPLGDKRMHYSRSKVEVQSRGGSNWGPTNMEADSHISPSQVSVILRWPVSYRFWVIPHADAKASKSMIMGSLCKISSLGGTRWRRYEAGGVWVGGRAGLHFENVTTSEIIPLMGPFYVDVWQTHDVHTLQQLTRQQRGAVLPLDLLFIFHNLNICRIISVEHMHKDNLLIAGLVCTIP